MVRSLDSYSSVKDVTYSCGYCGYALNLSSSTRNTANIGSKYGKQIKKGVVSFFALDESRFTQADEVTCVPYFHSRRSWGLFRRRSRLLCRKCGGRIGSAYDEDDDPAAAAALSSACDGSDDLRTSSSGSSGGGSSASSQKNYVIKINALQPSSDDSDAVALTL
uniref:MsrB domain-containing protein n=1 Tax=Leersia perrieri TaxID=77586 RepID=A0A0D9V7G7_9ORYZ